MPHEPPGSELFALARAQPRGVEDPWRFWASGPGDRQALPSRKPVRESRHRPSDAHHWLWPGERERGAGAFELTASSAAPPRGRDQAPRRAGFATTWDMREARRRGTDSQVLTATIIGGGIQPRATTSLEWSS
jgi:hypothetical protein